MAQLEADPAEFAAEDYMRDRDGRDSVLVEMDAGTASSARCSAGARALGDGSSGFVEGRTGSRVWIADLPASRQEDST